MNKKKRLGTAKVAKGLRKGSLVVSVLGFLCGFAVNIFC